MKSYLKRCYVSGTNSNPRNGNETNKKSVSQNQERKLIKPFLQFLFDRVPRSKSKKLSCKILSKFPIKSFARMLWGLKSWSFHSLTALVGGSFILLFLDGSLFVDGIRCYECSSSWNDDCTMSPPPSRYLKLCSVPLCSKFYAEENGIVRVERYCGGSDFSNGCRDASFPDRSPGLRYRAVSCRCNDQDGCNSTSQNKATPISVLLLGLLIPTMFAASSG